MIHINSETKKPLKKTIIVSAVNLVEGGPLTVLQECLGYLSGNLSEEYEIIALVNKKELASFKNIRYFEFPKAKKSWLMRLYYEYIYFRRFSKEIKPHLWLSLHDITPNVRAKILAVYCHNPAIFYKLNLKEILIEPKLWLFNLFYKYLYMINIKRNNWVIVQQSWIRENFKKLFKIENIIVAHPDVKQTVIDKRNRCAPEQNGKFIFFYPALARVFKNFEIIGEAARILTDQGLNNFEIYLTINGTENKYSNLIYNKYKGIPSIKFIGIQPKEAILDYYSTVNCLIFPSKLETWGLPINEFKDFSKPMLLADLEYAKETIGDYDKVKFFDPNNPKQLSDIMKDTIQNKTVFDKTKAKIIPNAFASNWNSLFKMLLIENDTEVKQVITSS